MADTTINFPLGKIWKALHAGQRGYTIVAGSGSRKVALKDAQGNIFGAPNWLESMGITISAFNNSGLDGTAIDNLLSDVRDKMDTALLAYAGKDLQDIPDNIPVTLSDNELPALWEPFGTLIPGVPNPGVNPVTGETPIDTLASFGGAFLGFLFGIDWLRVIVAIIAAFLVWEGYKRISGETGTTINVPKVMPVPV